MRLTPDIDKITLRDEMRLRRLGLSGRIRTRFDQKIQRHLLKLVKSRHARSIACYWPFNGEPDIIPVCQQLMSDGHRLALPVVSGKNDHRMQFHPWQAETTLAKNRYGILEPQGSICVELTDFDMLLMPLVAYDRLGNRLGMCSGYYDRHLESLRDSKTPLRVGIAYSAQEIEPMDKNIWDISLHGVVNEHGWFTFV